MKDSSPAKTVILLLSQQTELMNRLESMQRQLQGEVEKRNMQTMEELIPVMTGISEEVATLEEQRNSAFLDLSIQLGCSGDLAGVLARIDPATRNALSQAYRELKIAVLRLQGSTAMLDTYLRTTVMTGRSILTELFPEHTSGRYAKDGQGEFHSTSAMMINTQH